MSTDSRMLNNSTAINRTVCWKEYSSSVWSNITLLPRCKLPPKKKTEEKLREKWCKIYVNKKQNNRNKIIYSCASTCTDELSRDAQETSSKWCLWAENYVVRYRWVGGLLITIYPFVLLEFFINPGLISFPFKMHYMTDNLSILQVSLFLTRYPPNF